MVTHFRWPSDGNSPISLSAHLVCIMSSGGIFSLGRSEGFPSQYGENRTSVTEDIVEVVLLFIFITLSACFVVVLLPRCGGKARVFLLLRIVIGLFVGTILLTCNYGQMWEVGRARAKLQYKAGDPKEVDAKVGVLIGLRSVNITLSAVQEDHSAPKEDINYNERFSWVWDQGRIGFGPYAGRVQREFRAAQRRGLPLPILWVAEYFTIDGEGFRFGRNYRTAGWYAHIALWAAVPSWILSNLLFQTVVRYGALWSAITGGLQLFACLIWWRVRNPIPLQIPLAEEEIVTHFGPCFWLAFSSGALCMLIGCVVTVTDLRFPDETAVFFGKDPLSEYEECHLHPQEVDLMRTKAAKQWEELLRQRKRDEMMQMQPVDDVAFDVIEMDPHTTSYDPVTPAGLQTLSPGEPLPMLQPSEGIVLKRGSTVRRAQKSLIRTPAPVATTNIPFYLGIPEEEY